MNVRKPTVNTHQIEVCIMFWQQVCFRAFAVPRICCSSTEHLCKEGRLKIISFNLQLNLLRTVVQQFEQNSKNPTEDLFEEG